MLDPASAPGTGTPEVAGLQPREALGVPAGARRYLVHGVRRRRGLAAYDSPGQITALNAAAVAYDLLALLAVARSRVHPA